MAAQEDMNMHEILHTAITAENIRTVSTTQDMRAVSTAEDMRTTSTTVHFVETPYQLQAQYHDDAQTTDSTNIASV